MANVLPLKLFRNFTEKRTRGLSLQMVFSLLFPETLLNRRVLCQVTWRGSTTWRLGIPKHREKALANTREVQSSSRQACDCRSASKRFPLMFEGVRYMGRVSLGYWLAACKHLTPFLVLYFVTRLLNRMHAAVLLEQSKTIIPYNILVQEQQYA